MASIGQLAAGVAHEINNPMGFISSNLGSLEKYQRRIQEYLEASAEFLAAEGGDSLTALRKSLKLDYILEDIPGLITESREGAQRVQAIVANLKSFSRVDQDKYKKANLNECLESTLNIVWNELKYKTTVSKEYGDLPETYCSPQALNQVFMNLLINAAQAIDQQGEIRIKTWSENGQYIFISISDSGQGIAPEILTKIFDPFFTTKEVGKGTGLGLSICYDIVKQHEGEICVKSKVGKGTTFNIVLPVKQEGELQSELCSQTPS
jgi:two-component system NtrC family sensor kinase